MKHKGQNLVETLIVFSVIVVGAIVALTLLGNNVGNIYQIAADKVSGFNPFGEHVKSAIATETSGVIMGGSLGGTPDNPVEQCNSGKCDIDYGEFVLSGIPENLSEIVQTNGTSGGTDQLISLATQIADQLEKEKPAESLEIRKFASIGHNIAVLEKEYEKVMNSCKPDIICVKNNYSISKPDAYDETFYQFSSWYNISQVGVGALKRSQTDDPAWYNEALENQAPSVLFVDKYDSLMKSDLSDTTKGILQELYWQVGKLSEDVLAGLIYVYNDGDTSTYVKDYIDPITGEYKDNPDLPDDPFAIYSNYAPSTVTHVDSALICAAGYNKDTGTKCH